LSVASSLASSHLTPVLPMAVLWQIPAIHTGIAEMRSSKGVSGTGLDRWGR
jgi:hypothetical protein